MIIGVNYYVFWETFEWFLKTIYKWKIRNINKITIYTGNPVQKYGAAFLTITGFSFFFVTMVYKPFNFPQYENMDLSIIVSAWQGSNMQKILQKQRLWKISL